MVVRAAQKQTGAGRGVGKPKDKPEIKLNECHKTVILTMSFTKINFLICNDNKINVFALKQKSGSC